MEAKRIRLTANNNHIINAERLELKNWQNLQVLEAQEDNYVNRLLESTRNFIVASEELSVENEAISTAIHEIGLKKTTPVSLPSSRQLHSTSSSSTENLESEAINSAINQIGLTAADLRGQVHHAHRFTKK